MRWIIHYLRQCFCKHDFELIAKVRVKDEWTGESDHWTYFCKKCGYVRKVEI